MNKIIIERNKQIKFDEKNHKYYVDKKELISVSNTIHQFFPKFLANKVAEEMSKGCKLKQKELLNDWEIRNKSGTAVHKFLEDYIKLDIDPKDEVFQEKADEIGTTLDNLKLRFMAGKQFIKDMKKEGWKPFIAEWMVWSEDLGLAGTIDLPFINDKGEIYISDYKCTKGIYKQSYPKRILTGYDGNGIPRFKYESQKGFFPVEHLDNCNYILYSLQLTAYKYIIEKEYGLKVVGASLIHLPQGSSRYVPIETLDLVSEFEDLVENKT